MLSSCSERPWRGHLEQTIVLVAAHHAEIRQLLTIMLQKANFRVITASNADEALYLLRNQERIDFVLTDVNLVGGSITGIGLAELVRHENPATKVLLMSGLPESQELAAERGLPIVSKPFVPTVLIQRIRGMLAEIPAQIRQTKRWWHERKC